MREQRTHVVRLKSNGQVRTVTRTAYHSVREGFYELLEIKGQEVEKPVKKKEVVNDAEDHSTIVFEAEVSAIDELRSEYKSLKGKKADKRWKEERLIEEIANLKQ